MSGLIIGDGGFVLEGQSDIVETVKQAVTRELVSRKTRREASSIIDRALFEIDRQLVSWQFRGSPRDFITLLPGQHHREHTILNAVVGKDVGKGRSNHCAKSVISERPDSVLSR